MHEGVGHMLSSLFSVMPARACSALLFFVAASGWKPMRKSALDRGVLGNTIFGQELCSAVLFGR